MAPKVKKLSIKVILYLKLKIKKAMLSPLGFKTGDAGLS
jgi:hypothetical protein